MGWHAAIVVLVVLVLSCGCSGDSSPDSGNLDGNPLDGFDAGGDPGGGDEGDRGQDGGDISTGCSPDDFALVVPPGTQVCSVGSGQEALEHYFEKRRIALKEGTVCLPRDEETFAADWIERLELAPDGRAVPPDGPGVFTRTLEGTPDNGTYLFEYRRTYDDNGQAYELVLAFAFEVLGGTPLAPVKVIDEQTLKRDYQVAMSVRVTIGMICGVDFFDRHRRLLWMANGDTLEVDLLTWMGCLEGADGCAGGAGYGEVVRATFARGQEERGVEGFFDTSFGAIHHLGGQSYVLILDQPLGAIHGLHVTAYMDEARYLDEGMQPVETSDVTDYRLESCNRDWTQCAP